MYIRLHKKFVKDLDASPVFIRNKTRIQLEKFREDPFDPALHNHPLQGKRKGQRSIDITGDRRIVFKELSDGRYALVELIELGTHSQLYR